MRSPELTGPPIPGFRTPAVAVLTALLTIVGLQPSPLAAKIRKSHTSSSKTTTRKLSKVDKSRRSATPAKVKHARSTQHHTPIRRIRRAPDPDELVVAQGDGSPVLQSAAEFLGRPYRFGSEEQAFDCSGFVRSVFAKIGIDLPHSAREQFSLGERVARDELEPGDLVFFHTYRRSASHVGIYVGEDKFVHAAMRGGQVQVDSLSQSYYARRYLGARRLDL